MNARSEQREGPSLACVKPGRALAAAALLVAVTLQSVQAAERGKHSREYVRLKREYEALPNSLDDPERWQDVVAKRLEYLQEIRETQAGRPELQVELRGFVQRILESIARDGTDACDGCIDLDARDSEPFRRIGLDVVSWIEDENQHVALANGSGGRLNVEVKLSVYRRNLRPDEPGIASANVELAPGEVVIVRFDGIPLTWDRNDKSYDPNDYSAETVVLVTQNGRRAPKYRVRLQSTAGWLGTPAAFVTPAGKVKITFPSSQGIYSIDNRRLVEDYTIYVSLAAQSRRRPGPITLVPDDETAVVEADVGTFVHRRTATFTLDLPETDDYDLVYIPCVMGRRQKQYTGRLGAVLIQLGKRTPVRRVTVPLPPKHRLDNEPLSDDPQEKIAQLKRWLRSDLWTVRHAAERKIAAIGAPAVPAMVKLLSSTEKYEHAYDEIVQRSAVPILTQIGEPAVGALAPLLGSRERSIGSDAGRVLGGIGGRGVDVLLKAASSARLSVRMDAVAGLLKTRDPRRLPALKKLTRDKDPKLRRWASLLLQMLEKEQITSPAPTQKPPQPRAPGKDGLDGWAGLSTQQKVKLARNFIKALGSKNEATARRAADELARSDDPATAPELFILAEQGDSPEPPRPLHSALFALRKLWAGKKLGYGARSAMALLLAAKSGNVRRYAAYIIGAAGIELAVPELIGALSDPSSGLRNVAKEALTDLGYEVSSAPGNRYALADPDYRDRTDSHVRILVDMLGDDNYFRRKSLVSELAARGEDAIAPLKRALKDERPLVRLCAIRALGGTDHPQARETLAQMTTGPDKLMARRAVVALAQAPVQASLPLWTKLLSDSDPGVRAGAARALGRIGKGESVRPLLALLDERNITVFTSAARALGELGGTVAAEALVEGYMSLPNGESADYPGANKAARRTMREALVNIGKPAAPALIRRLSDTGVRDMLKEIGDLPAEPVLAVLKEGNVLERGNAARLVGWLKIPGGVRALIELSGGWLKSDNNAGFAALTTYGEAARPELRKALDDGALNDLARASAAAVLVTLGDKPRLDLMNQVAQKGDTGSMNRFLERLSRLRRQEFLPVLEKALARADAARAVVYAISSCGADRAEPLLEKALEHPNASVRTEARKRLNDLRNKER